MIAGAFFFLAPSLIYVFNNTRDLNHISSADYIYIPKDNEFKRRDLKWTLKACKLKSVFSSTKGTFYLSSKDSFIITFGNKEGLGVGGIYMPKDSTQLPSLWSLSLKNENRNFNSPSISRVLKNNKIQPEWYDIQKSEFIKKYSIINHFIFIDTDFSIERKYISSKPIFIAPR